MEVKNFLNKNGFTFNRTTLELKQEIQGFYCQTVFAFNRTTLELKHEYTS